MITFIPTGGLGNRIKAITSAIALADTIKSDLHIIWFQDWGLKCCFDELFSPITLPGISLKEASFSDKYLLDKPRKKNFYIPYLYEHFHFDDCLYEKEVTSRYFEHFDFLSWSKKRNVYLASCISFFLCKDGRKINDIFHPNPHLKNIICNVTKTLPKNIIGVHIRRTDNIKAIYESPIELFIDRMKKEPHETYFYLATDSEKVKIQLKQIFGDRIITSSYPACRNNQSGIQNALVELYTLSNTSLIIGSSHSTFSEIAAKIGHIKCEIIKRA